MKGIKPSVAAACAALLVLAIAAAVTLQKGKKRQEESAILDAVAESSQLLRAALGPQAPADAAARLDADLSTIKAAARTPLAEAAEDYVLGAREIARHRAALGPLEQQWAASRQAIRAHLAGGGRRNEAWFQAAGTLKKRMEEAHFQLGVELKALDSLLDGMPESVRRTTPLAGEGRVVDLKLFFDARQQVQAQLRSADEELERARQIPAG
jgi:hypothetical protein